MITLGDGPEVPKWEKSVCCCAGIGKSIFGYKLLHRWACEGRRVVVVKRGDCPTPVLLTVDGAYELDRVALQKELDDPDVRLVAYPVRAS